MHNRIYLVKYLMRVSQGKRLWKNYTSHNTPRGSYFRSCAVSGADWNPESGFTKCVDVWKTGNDFMLNLWGVNIQTHWAKCPAASQSRVQGQWKVWAERVSGALRFQTLWLQMSAASPFHPPCRLFFVTFALLKESERSLRSELKPGYSLKSSQITDSVRIVLFPRLLTGVSCTDCSLLCVDNERHLLWLLILGASTKSVALCKWALLTDSNAMNTKL